MPTANGSVIHLSKPGIPEQVDKAIYEKPEIEYGNLKTTTIVA